MTRANDASCAWCSHRKRPSREMSMSRAKNNRRRSKPVQGSDQILTLGSLTQVGMTRSSNQDAYCAILPPNLSDGVDALLAVADGMGGHQAGETASTMAIHELVSHLSPQGANGAIPTRGADALSELIQQINWKIHQASGRPETQGMGTTLTVALLAGSTLTIGHVGDSRVYLLRQGQLSQLSRDHSWVAEQVARGILAPDAAHTHPRRNILTRAVGIAPEVEVDEARTRLQEGDTLLLCSDGLHSLVADEESSIPWRHMPHRRPASYWWTKPTPWAAKTTSRSLWLEWTTWPRVGQRPAGERMSARRKQ